MSNESLVTRLRAGAKLFQFSGNEEEELAQAATEAADAIERLSAPAEPVATLWETVPGFPGYEVSRQGELRRSNGRPVSTRALAGMGYPKATLHQHGKRLQTYVHRIVALAFLGDPPTECCEVNHKNGVKTDNRVENLEWVTRSENAQHSRDILGQLCYRVVAISPTGEETEYASTVEAAHLGGFTPNGVQDCLSGRRKSHKGFTFRRAHPAAPVPNPAPGYCKHCKQYTIEEPLPAAPAPDAATVDQIVTLADKHAAVAVMKVLERDGKTHDTDESRAALRAAVERVAKDAARYRWLRTGQGFDSAMKEKP